MTPDRCPAVALAEPTDRYCPPALTEIADLTARLAEAETMTATVLRVLRRALEPTGDELPPEWRTWWARRPIV